MFGSPAWVRSPHTAGELAPESSARTLPPTCGSMAVRVIRESPRDLLAPGRAAAAGAPAGRITLLVLPLRLGSNALAPLHATLAGGPVLVGSRRFAPFPWVLRPPMKPDSSTLLKPEILILRRHAGHRVWMKRGRKHMMMPGSSHQSCGPYGS